MDIENVIDDQSILANQPELIKTKLYDYQAATLYHAINFEKNKKINIQDDGKEIIIKTNMGVIANKVGSGKSLIALSLINNEELKQNNYICSFVSNNNLLKEYIKTDYIYYLKLNLIVVPHNLINQWEGYIVNDTEFKYSILAKKKDVQNIFGDITLDENIEPIEEKKLECINRLKTFIENKQILLISSTFFIYFVNLLYYYGLEKEICFERIFYDEADSINLSNNKKLEAKFYWFISSSENNLKKPNAEFRYIKTKIDSDPKYIRYRLIKDGGISKNGFIKNSFESIKNYDRSNNIYLKCDENFINNSLKIPKPIINIVKVKNPYILNILGKYASRDIKKLIAEGDILGAIQKLNCNYNPQQDIIKIFTEKIENQLEDKINLLELVEKKKEITEDDRTKKIEKIKDEIQSLKEKISYICERIQDKQICPISGDEIINETYTPCCKKCFELENIISWLEIKTNCPICRENLKPEQMFVRNKEKNKKNSETIKPKTKYEEVINIISTNNKKRILIFSENNNTFEVLEKELKKINVKYDILNGNNNRVNKILTNYREDTSETRIILMNIKNYGCGLNLENTTDIILMHSINELLEKQVIGRAQRNGRNNQLNIWKIFYEDELINN